MKKLSISLMAAVLPLAGLAVTPQEQPLGAGFKQSVKMSRSARLAAPAPAAAQNTFFEGFEERPPLFGNSADEWLPEGWQDVSKAGNKVPARPTDGHNLTWRVTDNENKNNGPVVQTDAYEGEAFAYIMADVAYSGHTDLATQDEWLITPAITPVGEDWLYFKLFYNPGWTLYNREKNDFTGQNNTLEVYCSTDDGQNWTRIWSLIDDEIKVNLTEGELRASLIDIFSKDYTPIYVDIKQYRGKSVKFAFRYFGSLGHPVAIDNVAVGVPEPVASFQIPGAAFRQGISPTIDYPVEPSLLIPYDRELTWKNTSNDVLTNEWTYADASGATATYNRRNLITPAYECGSVVATPTLKGFFESRESELFETGYPTMQVGGTIWGRSTDGYEGEFGVGVYDITSPDNKIRMSSDLISFHAKVDSVWELNLGRLPGSIEVEGICNFYEKSDVPYGFDYVDVAALIKQDFDPDADLICAVYALDDYGDITALLGESHLSGADIPAANLEYYTNLRFKFDVPVYVYTDIYVVVFNPCVTADGSYVKGQISFPYVMSPKPNTGNTMMYVWVYDNETGWLEQFVNLNTLPLTNGYFAGMLMNLGASYSYVERLDSKEFDLGLDGGSATFRVKALHKPERWALTLDGLTRPSWIDFTTKYIATEDAYDVTINVGKNPTANDYDTELFIVTPGSIAGIPFRQPDNPASVDEIGGAAPSLTAVCDPSGRIDINGAQSTVRIYTVAGALVATARPDAAGHATVNGSHLAPGVYVVKADATAGACKFVK